jgi:hypothetical protein
MTSRSQAWQLQDCRRAELTRAIQHGIAESPCKRAGDLLVANQTGIIPSRDHNLLIGIDVFAIGLLKFSS